MKNIISHKIKQYLIVSCTAFCAVYIIYQLAIQETIDLSQDNIALETRLDNLENIEEKITALKNEIIAIDQKIGSSSPNAALILIEEITSYCQKNNLKIKSIPESIVQDENQLSIQYQCFTVLGNFKNVLQLANYLEQKRELGKVISFESKIQIDHRSKRRSLLTQITVQNVLIKGYEKSI